MPNITSAKAFIKLCETLYWMFAEEPRGLLYQLTAPPFDVGANFVGGGLPTDQAFVKLGPELLGKGFEHDELVWVKTGALLRPVH